MVDVRSLDPVVVRDWLREIYLPERTIVGHNLIFDLPRLQQQFQCGYPAKVFDTQLAEQLLTAGIDIEEHDDGEERQLSRSLQATARRRLNVLISKDQDTRTGFQLEGEWSQEMLDYAALDASVLVPLFRLQWTMLSHAGMTAVTRIEMAALPVFAEAWRRGITLDADGMRQLMQASSDERDVLEVQLQALLTPHLTFPRLQHNAAEEQALFSWNQNYNRAHAAFCDEWVRVTGTLDPDAEQSPWAARWLGVTIPGSKKPITDAEIDSWHDLSVPKGKTFSAGMTRFTRRMLQHWRTEPGNARPIIGIKEIDAAINMRSIPDKTAAIAQYVIQFPGAEPPANFRRKTLTAWGAGMPQQVRDDLVVPLQRFTKLDKLTSSFGDSLQAQCDAQHRLHPGFRTIGTATGRPSCSRPNLLQMPSSHAFRHLFVASPGNVLIVADFSQMELRLLAEMSGDVHMTNAFTAGRDLHAEAAAGVFGVPFAAVTTPQRKTAKVVNFGTSYGMAKHALQYQLAGEDPPIFVTLEEADAYLKNWRTTFAQAWHWIEAQGALAVKQGFTETALGRKRYFDLVALKQLEDPQERRAREGKIRREGANHPIQGGNADITKLAMGCIQPQLAAFGGSILLSVYDELVAEVPEQHAEEARRIVDEGMRMAASVVLTTVPVAVDCVISRSWSEQDALYA